MACHPREMKDSYRFVWALVLILVRKVEGLAERYKLSYDATSFLTTKGGQSGASPLWAMHFHDYVEKFGRSYQPGTAEYERRRALFEERVLEAQRHNARPDRLWEAGVNELTDRTPEELQRLRGYGRNVRPAGGPGPELVGTSAVEFDLSKLPKEFSWQGVLRATTEVQDQDQCGSCWAFASATVLRAHSELFQKDHHFSVQQIVSCTPNPRECGGQGGCTGATAELAMHYVSQVGSLSEKDFPYTATEEECPSGLRLQQPLDVSTVAGPSLHQIVSSGTDAASLGLTGFLKLPENQLEPILLRLFAEGPLAVSIAAGSGWNMYWSGIYDSCQRDIVIDHAVMLVGWGEDKPAKYWQLQNSWGPSWGEGGFIRIIRHDLQTERSYCGWDTDPSIGSGCRGGPSSVWICGSCGILYDVVMPTFSVGQNSWWARHGRNVTDTSLRQ
uniref:Peptidase C1A papain C-terminal domain-containing protein n=1 Tax=Alexandrium monilatum TaxID=311494 RepID=A0A7S4S2P4_9DINO